MGSPGDVGGTYIPPKGSSGGTSTFEPPQYLGLTAPYVYTDPSMSNEFTYTGPVNPNAVYNTPGGVLNPAIGGIPPKYQDGNETTIALSLGGPGLIDLQNRLQDAGLYTRDYQLGSWGAADAAAFQQVLAYANQNGLDWNQALDRLITNSQTTGFKRDANGNILVRDPKTGKWVTQAELNKPKRVFQYQLPSEQDLRNGALKTMQDLYGGELPAGELDRWIQGYRTMSVFNQRAAFDMAGGEEGDPVAGEVPSTPSPDAALSDTIRFTHPNEVFANSLNNQLTGIMGALTESPYNRAGR